MHTIRHTDDSFDEDPSPQVFSALYDELETASVEHGDVSVVHEDSGWCISAHRDHRVVFAHLGDGGARHMIPVSKEKVLELWRKLIEGDIESIQSEPWRPGYT